MAYYTKEEINEFYSIISNLVEPEIFNNNVSENGSRSIIDILCKDEIASKLTIDQLKKLNDKKWDNMFISGIAHISWKNGDRHSLFTAFRKYNDNKRLKYVELEDDGAWFENLIYWYISDNWAIKETYHRAKSFSSSCSSEWYHNIVDPEEAPKEPDMCVVALAVCDGRAYLHSQFTGSQKECELWADKTVEKCNALKIRYIDLRNDINQKYTSL